MSKKITNFALDIDEQTLHQFDSCCNEKYVKAASLMPDAHSGYVAPIGSVLVTQDELVPAWVGYDIGCGMVACVLQGDNLREKAFEYRNEIFNEVNKNVPMGVGKIGVHGDVSPQITSEFKSLLQDLKTKKYNKDIFKFLNTQSQAHLGSLGSGNHFIELGVLEAPVDNSLNNYLGTDTLWLIVHSGSRGVGRHIATHYMKAASLHDQKYESTHSLKLNSKEGQEYLDVVDFGLEFALLNRKEIVNRVVKSISKVLDITIDVEIWTNKNHNHVLRFKNELEQTTEFNSQANNTQTFIHRKGATPAMKGERGVIPANMRDGCFLVKGLGNQDFLYSSSHGAGRVMSRREAQKKITLSEFKDSMQGVVGKVDDETIDESPFVYKNIYDVMEAQKESVISLGCVKPIINWKGG